MSLLDEFRDADRAAIPVRCTVAKIRAALDDDRNGALTAAMADQTITSKAVASVLSNWTGDRVTHWMVSNHRRRNCACREV